MDKPLFNTPILFLIFNRPDVTELVFEEIRKVRPAHLFIAADGPRDDKQNEKEICEKTRNTVINNINWQCEVHTLFREKNLGCSIAVSEAITWFFDNVEEGIILEDDCLPAQSFFRFCEKMLIKYRNNEQVYSITGTNLLETWNELDNSCVFSTIGGIWGWASWRRAWARYDFQITDWNNKKTKKNVKDHLKSSKAFSFFAMVFDHYYQHSPLVSSWDFQWFFTILSNRAFTVVPPVNQIQNIGFGEGATHTLDPEDKLAFLKFVNLNFPLKEPNKIAANRKFDRKSFDQLYKVNPKLSLLKRLKNKLISRYFNSN